VIVIGEIKQLILQLTPSVLSRLNYVAMVADLAVWCRRHPCPTFSSRHELYQSLVKSDDRIDFLEFGVARGKSLEWWLEYNKNLESKFRGYDVFSGLPERWMRLPEKTFAQPVPQIDDDRCEIIVGMFQNTLIQRPEFHGGKIIIHMDADLYSSTLYILTTVKPPSGSIVIFDEFSSPLHEFKAFSEFAESHYADYAVLGKTANYTQVAMELRDAAAR
jgi:O-methyltransferase